MNSLFVILFFGGQTNQSRLGVVDDVRTREFGKKSRLRKVLKEIRAALDEPECRGLIENIRTLKGRFEPAAVATVASRSAKAG